MFNDKAGGLSIGIRIKQRKRHQRNSSIKGAAGASPAKATAKGNKGTGLANPDQTLSDNAFIISSYQ